MNINEQREVKYDESGRIIIIPKPLSNEQVEKLRNYLKEKYSLDEEESQLKAAPVLNERSEVQLTERARGIVHLASQVYLESPGDACRTSFFYLPVEEQMRYVYLAMNKGEQVKFEMGALKQLEDECRRILNEYRIIPQRTTIRNPDQPEHTFLENPSASQFEVDLTEVMVSLEMMLIAKNKAYGDSALNPINIFSAQSAGDLIDARIDDKLSRIKNRKTYQGDNDLVDLTGYLILKLINNKRKEANNESAKEKE